MIRKPEKRYAMIVTITEKTQFYLTAVKEGWDELIDIDINRIMSDDSIIIDRQHPYTIKLGKPVSFIEGIFKAIRYWKIGISILVIKKERS